MKPHTQSAFLYVWLAVAPLIIGELHSDTAKGIVPMPWLWFVTLLFSASNVGAVALKSFRSKEYGEAQEAIKDDPKQIKLPLSLLVGAVSLVALSGCSFSRIQRGDAIATNLRCFWHTEGFEFIAGTNGTTTIRIVRTSPDAESLKAIAEGAAKGAVQGAK